MDRAGRWTNVALAAALAASLARAQTTERVSVDSSGAQGNSWTDYTSSISADGRFVAFSSDASNLVAGDTNGVTDVFVHERQSGVTERVSVSTDGAQGNSASSHPSISADGRFVAFSGEASNLVAGDTNGWSDVFVRDRRLGTTERVSVATGGAQGNLNSCCPTISADGRSVAFLSGAWNLVPGDTNGFQDVLVHDLRSGTTERASVATGGTEGNDNSGGLGVSISADGRFVAFSSDASNLVANDTNAVSDIFVRDRQGGTTERASVDAGGAQGNFSSWGTSISADGRFVAFASGASNLVAGDTNAAWDIFVRDRRSGAIERVNVSTEGAEGNANCLGPSISADGRFVAFWGDASNLVAGDTNITDDVFEHDRLSGTTERSSVATGGAQAQAQSESEEPVLSADGRYVAFYSTASNLVPGDTNQVSDIFERDRGLAFFLASCFGNGTEALCPCFNLGLLGHGCENSSGTGGALLSGSGNPSLSTDTFVLSSAGEKPTALSIFLQGSALVPHVVFGDGLRCAGGTLERLFFVEHASGGVATAPQAGDPSVSARSAALGDVLAVGAMRHYQTYYRDPDPAFCPSPQGNTWNVSNALSAVWNP
jgi:Tol biopolymer transport system component